TSTDASGSFSGAAFTVPASTAGAHIVAATAGAQSANATYTVTPSLGAPSPTSGDVGSAVHTTEPHSHGNPVRRLPLGRTPAALRRASDSVPAPPPPHTLALHDALPISPRRTPRARSRAPPSRSRPPPPVPTPWPPLPGASPPTRLTP